MSLRATIQRIAAARGIFLEDAKPGDPDNRMRFRVPAQHASLDIDEHLPSLRRGEHAATVGLLDRLVTDVQRVMFRATTDHIAKHDHEPLDRLRQIEAASRTLLDALGLSHTGRLDNPLTKAAAELENLLRAKPGAASWQRDGYGKDPEREARNPLDPTRTFSEGGAPEHRAALGIDCPACDAPAGRWCPMPGTTWNLCGQRIEAAREQR